MPGPAVIVAECVFCYHVSFRTTLLFWNLDRERERKYLAILALPHEIRLPTTTRDLMLFLFNQRLVLLISVAGTVAVA